MVAGRPRTTVPEHDEVVALGKDLVKWSSEKTDEVRLRWCNWYAGKQSKTAEWWDLLLQKPEFRGYYEIAQQHLANKWLTTMNPSIAHRFLRIYCPDLKRDENEEAEFKASLAKEVGGSISDVQQAIIDTKRRS